MRRQLPRSETVSGCANSKEIQDWWELMIFSSKCIWKISNESQWIFFKILIFYFILCIYLYWPCLRRVDIPGQESHLSHSRDHDGSSNLQSQRNFQKEMFAFFSPSGGRWARKKGAGNGRWVGNQVLVTMLVKLKQVGLKLKPRGAMQLAWSEIQVVAGNVKSKSTFGRIWSPGGMTGAQAVALRLVPGEGGPRRHCVL